MNAVINSAPTIAELSYDEAVQLARDLVPALRTRAAQAEAARVMLP